MNLKMSQVSPRKGLAMTGKMPEQRKNGGKVGKPMMGKPKGKKSGGKC